MEALRRSSAPTAHPWDRFATADEAAASAAPSLLGGSWAHLLRFCEVYRFDWWAEPQTATYHVDEQRSARRFEVRCWRPAPAGMGPTVSARWLVEARVEDGIVTVVRVRKQYTGP
jgi:hypothetical protein